MEQAQLAKGPAQAGVWVEAKPKVKVEAGWAGRLPQGRAEVVPAQTAVRRSLMLPDNHVIKEVVRSVVRK